jgi:hypothetical protein
LQLSREVFIGCSEELRREIDVRKWAAISGILGATWMLVLLWADSQRLVHLTNYPAQRLVYLTTYPALLLTVSLVSIHGTVFIFYAALVLSSAIQWAVIGLLFRAILQKISK